MRVKGKLPEEGEFPPIVHEGGQLSEERELTAPECRPTSNQEDLRTCFRIAAFGLALFAIILIYLVYMFLS